MTDPTLGEIDRVARAIYRAMTSASISWEDAGGAVDAFEYARCLLFGGSCRISSAGESGASVGWAD